MSSLRRLLAVSGNLSGPPIMTAGQYVISPGVYEYHGYVGSAISSYTGIPAFGSIAPTTTLNGEVIEMLTYTYWTTYSIYQTDLYTIANGGGATSITIDSVSHDITYSRTDVGFDVYEFDTYLVFTNGNDYELGDLL